MYFYAMHYRLSTALKKLHYHFGMYLILGENLTTTPTYIFYATTISIFIHTFLYQLLLAQPMTLALFYTYTKHTHTH